MANSGGNSALLSFIEQIHLSGKSCGSTSFWRNLHFPQLGILHWAHVPCFSVPWAWSSCLEFCNTTITLLSMKVKLQRDIAKKKTELISAHLLSRRMCLLARYIIKEMKTVPFYLSVCILNTVGVILLSNLFRLCKLSLSLWVVHCGLTVRRWSLGIIMTLKWINELMSVKMTVLKSS